MSTGGYNRPCSVELISIETLPRVELERSEGISLRADDGKELDKVEVGSIDEGEGGE